MARSARSTVLLKECLADALLRLMQEKSFDKISAVEIAEKAEVGRSSWFRNFNSKSEALTFKLVQLWRRWAEDNGLARQRRYTLANSSDFFRFNYEIRQTLLLIHQAGVRSAIYDAFYQIMVPQYDASAEERYQARFYSYGLFGLLDEWIENGFRDSPEAMTQLLEKTMKEERTMPEKSNIILIAETGSDIPPETAAENGVRLVPMHVAMGDETRDDGAFPPEEVCAYYDRTGAVPKTSASSPEDFTQIFDAIHAAQPEAQILHLAYSAATTCSYQNAGIAAADRDYVTSLDTQQVSVAQAVVVLETARYLRENPRVSVEDTAAFARALARRTHMCFIPKNLDYLRSGGRVSNVAALTGNLLQIHPCIEMIDGSLVAAKKYRGSLEKLVPRLIRDYTEKYNLEKDSVHFIWSPGLSDEIKALAEKCARDLGYRHMAWMKTGCVITCHGGPGCFGIVGHSEP